MPPLVCVPIAMLDQSFPRDMSALQRVLEVLGIIQSQMAKNEIHLLLIPSQVQSCLNEYDWNSRGDDYQALGTIYYYLSQLNLNPNTRIVRESLADVRTYSPHPEPIGSTPTVLLSSWSDEMGKLLAKHDQKCKRNEYFIGIACDLGYAGFEKNAYENPENRRAFPLVGPNDIGTLDDAYEWVVLPGMENKSVSQADVKRNYRAIGASKIVPPHRDSHYKLEFPGKRPWTFPANRDKILDGFLDELVSQTGYPMPVLKHLLIEGKNPERKLRLRN